MQLSEILEENTIRSISKKTNISEENLEALFAGEFDVLQKVKTMGFISIIEREYGADLKPLRDQAAAYYADHIEESGMVLDAPVTEKKKGKNKFSLFVVLLLLLAASWYFVTKFDKEKLRGMIPFGEFKNTVNIEESVDHDPSLSIEHAIEQEEENSTENTMPTKTSIDENQTNQ